MSYKKSLIRAENLFSQKMKRKAYLIFKLPHSANKCCCFHCFPDVWREINEYLRQNGFGKIKDEGDLLIKKNGVGIVLECHETGMEIVLPLMAEFSRNVLASLVANLIGKFLDKGAFNLAIFVVDGKGGVIKEINSVELRQRTIGEEDINEIVGKSIDLLI